MCSIVSVTTVLLLHFVGFKVSHVPVLMSDPLLYFPPCDTFHSSAAYFDFGGNIDQCRSKGNKTCVIYL